MSFKGRDNLYKELWKACAGSMVDLPGVGDPVFYFPQGHLEQLEQSTSLDHILSPVNLPSKIHCRVVNIQLLAEEDDEVFAQITLLPEVIRTEHLESRPPQIPKPKFDSFSKVLGASDTNAHCRLHVLKQHADTCLPPLDMTQQTPSQVMSATDLHGIEWSFKHVFAGQPGRHLFTTGWSKFVTSKRLVAGDSFIFLRGENGKLRVGIRRLARSCNLKPSPCIPSESVDGVLATVSQAIATGTMFSVYYRPRKSQFIIGLARYREAVNHGFSVGMRYNMQFKGEDSIQRKYTATIIGVDDIDPRWHNSEWRSLKVCWDESTSITRPERVSLWEIEPLVASIPMRLVPPVESKNKHRMPGSQVVKKRKRKPEVQEKYMEDLGTVTKELSQTTVPSPESAGKRRADMPLSVALQAYTDFDNDAGVQELNNEGYNCEDDPTTHNGSKHMRSHPLGRRSTSSTNGITHPTFHDQSNQVLIDDLESGAQVEGCYLSDVAHSVLNSSPASDRSDSWFMALLRDFPEQFECQLEASPLREQHLPKDPCIPLQRTSSTELPCSPKVIYISSTLTQIPFSGPGNGNELINWEAYRVARRCVPILDRVITRYPAILSSFRAMSDTLQSILLQILAEVVYMLEQLTLENMDMERLGTARRYLMDLKMSGIDMSWLDGRLNHIDGVFKKNILVQRREELTVEVAEATAKVRRLEEELSSMEMEIEEIASRVGTDPLSTDQSVIHGLL